MTPQGGNQEPGGERPAAPNGPPAAATPPVVQPAQATPAMPPAAAPAAPQSGPAEVSWVEKAAAVVYCIFCIEIGLFLLIYPWMTSWERNYLVQIKPSLTEFLTSVQFRGAVSGLGILNLFAAVSEIVSLRRYSSR